MKKHASDAAVRQAQLVNGGIAASEGGFENPDVDSKSSEDDEVLVQPHGEEIRHAVEVLETLYEPSFNPDTLPVGDIPCVGEVVMLICDWWVANKASAQSAEQVWDLARTLLGRNNLVGDFATVQALLKDHRLQTMRKVSKNAMHVIVLLLRAIFISIILSANLSF